MGSLKSVAIMAIVAGITVAPGVGVLGISEAQALPVCRSPENKCVKFQCTRFGNCIGGSGKTVGCIRGRCIAKLRNP
jgi:hypothetical protein